MYIWIYNVFQDDWYFDTIYVQNFNDIISFTISNIISNIQLELNI